MDPCEIRSQGSSEPQAQLNGSEPLNLSTENAPASAEPPDSSNTRSLSQPPSPLFRLSEPSAFDNEFPSPSQSDGFAPGLPQVGPQVILHSVDGEERPLGEEDYSPAGISGSEGDQTEGFSSIKTIDDFGFGAWELSTRERSSRELPAQQEFGEHLSLVQTHSLTGVGGFVPSSQPGPSASNEDVTNYLDAGAIVDQIGNQIRSSYKTSSASNLKFLPLDRLSDIVSDVTVRMLLGIILRDAAEEDLEEHARQICGHDSPSQATLPKTMRKIVAILVLIGKVECVTDFIRGNVRDVDLPLKLEWCNNQYMFYKRGDEALTDVLTCFTGWHGKDMESFSSQQTIMLAPFLDIRDDQVCFYKLDYPIVLPYIEYGLKTHGGHGKVWRVKIHRAHHSFRSSQVGHNLSHNSTTAQHRVAK
jgi:hypothetical protein